MFWTRSRSGDGEPGRPGVPAPSAGPTDPPAGGEPPGPDGGGADENSRTLEGSVAFEEDSADKDLEPVEPGAAALRVSGMAASSEVLDESALRRLYAEHSGPVLAYLLRLTRDRARAEDLLQETMLRAWRRPAVFEPGRGSVRAWLCTVARNLVVDDVRARGARPQEAELNAGADNERDAPDPYEAALLGWEVADALQALSTEHRAVLVEIYYRRATVAEAAQTLGIPPGTVKSRTFYALRALRLACQERGITP